MIDIWDLSTYDAGIVEYLETHRDLIRAYWNRELELDNIELPRNPTDRIRFPMPTNEHHAAYRAAVDGLAPIIASKTFRAFHYSRMIDDEVDALARAGVRTTSVDFLRERVKRLIEADLLTRKQGEQIIIASALDKPHEFGVRDGFWTTALPTDPQDDRVCLLVRYWGGESAYWALQGQPEHADLLNTLGAIGRGRIIELAVPLSNSCSLAPGGAATNAFELFARELGYDRSVPHLDFNVMSHLPPTAIVKVHAEGDRGYRMMGAALDGERPPTD